MSIELRIDIEGDCTCGVPYQSVSWPPPHWHYIECDWGRIENSDANPYYGLRHLMLTTGDYIDQLLEHGPQERDNGGIASATRDGERVFAHVDYDGQRTTWEIFEAHWEDGLGPANVLIGRWPD